MFNKEPLLHFILIKAAAKGTTIAFPSISQLPRYQGQLHEIPKVS